MLAILGAGLALVGIVFIRRGLRNRGRARVMGIVREVGSLTLQGRRFPALVVALPDEREVTVAMRVRAQVGQQVAVIDVGNDAWELEVWKREVAIGLGFIATGGAIVYLAKTAADALLS